MNEEVIQTPEPVPSEPVLELPPDVVPTAQPVQVITVDELLERLAQEEPPAEEAEVADLPVDPDPVALALDQVVGRLLEIGINLGKIETNTQQIKTDTDVIQEQVAVVAQAVNHPALTTPFADYTVMEALLLFLLLAAFLSACARMLRGGLSWLRS